MFVFFSSCSWRRRRSGRRRCYRRSGVPFLLVLWRLNVSNTPACTTLAAIFILTYRQLAERKELNREKNKQKNNTGKRKRESMIRSSFAALVPTPFQHSMHDIHSRLHLPFISNYVCIFHLSATMQRKRVERRQE